MDNFIRNLDDSDLNMIIIALENYVNQEQYRLSQINASDQDWQRVLDYESLMTNIRFYLLSKKNRI